MINEYCFDGATHDFKTWKNDLVFCGKCLQTFTLTVDSTVPPEPTPPIEGNVKVFNARGTDDTGDFQQFLDSLGDGSVVDVRGVAAIGNAGVFLTSRKNIKITTSNRGGFRAIGTGEYSSPYSSLLFVENVENFSADGLDFNGNNRNAQALFVNNCLNPKILRCKAYDIQFIMDRPPFAAIRVDACTTPEIGFCDVRRATGKEGNNGVRGIWVGSGNSYCVRPSIHDNMVLDVGHTGIVTESTGPDVRNNTVVNILIQGTGYKFVPRGAADEAHFENNVVEKTANGGIMIGGSGVFPSSIIIKGWQAKTCGKDGTTFGFVYASGDVRNILVRSCVVADCKRIANLNGVRDCLFDNITVVSGSNVTDLEENVHNIRFTSAGNVSIGKNVSDIWVDGRKVI